MFYCSKTVEHNNRLKRRDNCLKRLKKTFSPFMTAKLMHRGRFFDAKFKQYPAVSFHVRKCHFVAWHFRMEEKKSELNLFFA